MKQQTNKLIMAESQTRLGIKDALSGKFRTIIRIQNKVRIALTLGESGSGNIFLIQNKGKDPPGRVYVRG